MLSVLLDLLISIVKWLQPSEAHSGSTEKLILTTIELKERFPSDHRIRKIFAIDYNLFSAYLS